MDRGSYPRQVALADGSAFGAGWPSPATPTNEPMQRTSSMPRDLVPAGDLCVFGLADS